MVTATSVTEILPGVYRWEVFSPEHRVELTSHAVRAADGLVVFDPIPVSAEVLDWFPLGVAPTALVLTNGNHERAAAEWSSRFRCPVFVPSDGGVAGPDWIPYQAGTAWERPSPAFPAGWEAMALPGGAPGETAFRLRSRELVVLGDAVVNLPGRPLELLPDRYCTDPAALRRSLSRLVEAGGFRHVLFAHGTPLLTEANRRLQGLVSAGRVAEGSGGAP